MAGLNVMYIVEMLICYNSIYHLFSQLASGIYHFTKFNISDKWEADIKTATFMQIIFIWSHLM